ncbi:MAG: DUF4340 domain-containing protein [Firmicutes bacterium]|nr:DUF4340 domain-containing protein [Bacillota bacterium]
MTKKKRNLILLLAATLIMGGLLWLVIRLDEENIDHTHDTDTSETSENVSSSDSGILINEDDENLKKIVYSNEKASYTVTLDKKAGEIVFSELKGLPVNQNFMEYIWYGVTQLTYDSVITSTDAEGYKASAYGLDKPSLMVNATFEGDKKYKFIAGSAVPGCTDTYYVRLSGDKNVYACAIDSVFFMGNDYFLSDDVFYSYDKDLESESDISIGNINLSGDNFDGKFVMQQNKTSNQSDPFCGYDYIVTSPIRWPAKSSSAALIVHELTYMTASDAVVLNPTKKQLKQYGFDTPSCTMNFTRNGKACTLYIGNITKTDMYVMLKGQPIIYSLDVDGLSMLHKLSPENIYSDTALSISIETISNIKIQSSNVKRNMAVSRKAKESTAAAEISEDVIYTYSVKVDGNDKKYSVYTNFIKLLNNSVVQNWNVKKPAGKPAVTITVDYFDNYGRKSDVIEFYKYSSRAYAVVWGDYPVNTVSATWLSQILENAEKL